MEWLEPKEYCFNIARRIENFGAIRLDHALHHEFIETRLDSNQLGGHPCLDFFGYKGEEYFVIKTIRIDRGNLLVRSTVTNKELDSYLKAKFDKVHSEVKEGTAEFTPGGRKYKVAPNYYAFVENLRAHSLSHRTSEAIMKAVHNLDGTVQYVLPENVSSFRRSSYSSIAERNSTFVGVINDKPFAISQGKVWVGLGSITPEGDYDRIDIGTVNQPLCSDLHREIKKTLEECRTERGLRVY